MEKAERYTENDLQVLGAVVRLTEEQSYPPTVRELAKVSGLALTTVTRALSRLQRHGLVDSVPHVARSIRPLGNARKVLRAHL